MSDASPRRKRVVVQAAIGVVILALFVTLAWYLRSERFRDRVRASVVEQLEQVTGGRVELKALKWNLSQLQFEATDLTIHGLEAPNEVPYAHFDRLLVRAKVISLFRQEIGLRYVAIERPIFHLIVYPDGTTNQPTPKVKQQTGRSSVEKIFDLAINRLELRNGELWLNERRIPLDFAASDFTAGATYDLLAKRYDGSIHIGKMDTKAQNFRPLASQAEVQFSLWPKAAEVKALKLSTARSQLEASGRLEDFNHPKIQLTYNASLSLAEAGGVARMAQIRGGTLVLNGSGTYTPQEFASAGKLFIKDLEYQDASVRLRGADASSDFSLDKQRIAAPNLSARVMGGTITGKVEIRDWRATQAGAANLKITSLPVAAVAGGISSRTMPLDKLHLAGAIDGTVEARWRGTPANADAVLALNITPPAQPVPEQIPLTATLRGVYRGAQQVLEISQLNLATRGTRLDAAGTLGTTSGAVNVALNTTDLGELKSAIAALQGPRQLPVELHGRASFTGKVSGKFKQPMVAGRLEVVNFESVIATQQRTRRVHWDLLTAEVQYAPNLVAARNGVLRHGSAQVHFDGSANLVKGKFTEKTPFSARVDVRNADIGELQALAGYAYLVSGTVNLTAQVEGTQADPRGQGKVQISKAVVYGEPIASITSDLVFANREAQLSNLDVAHNAARVRGMAAYNLGNSAFRFDLNGANIELARFKQLQTEKLKAAGVLDFTARGSGTKDAPTVNATLRLRNLVLNGENIGDLTADAVTQGEELRLTARSNFEDAQLTMDGGIRLRGDFPAELSLRFSQLDIDPLLRAYMKGRLTGHSQLAGTVNVRGPLRRPRELDVVGNVERLSAEVENIRIQNDGPVRFRMADQVVHIEKLRLVGDETNFSASGTVNLRGAQLLDLRAEGRVNLKLLQSLDAGLMSNGLVTLAVNVGGTLDQPALQGTMNIADGAISLIDLPNGLADINGTLVFNQDRLQIKTLNARTGGGMLDIGGFISYGGRTITFNLTAKGDDIRLRYPPGVSAMANADLRLTGSLQKSTLTGEIVVTKFLLNPQFDLALYLARSRQPPAIPNPKSPLNNLNFDVHMVSTPELQVQTSLAKITGDADLRLRGTGTRPVLLGRVNIIEGEVFFQGTKYNLERGDIIFANPARIEPIMDLEATARVRDYDITIGFHGPAAKLGTTYRSDPPLPVGDIVALLALGRTREEQATLQQQSAPVFTEQASNALLGEALNRVVSSRVQKLFGVSRIKIDPQVGGPENNPARLTVEQQVSNDITITYITDLTRSNQQTIQVEYNINRNVSIIAVRDGLNGVLGFDVRIRQRKK